MKQSNYRLRNPKLRNISTSYKTCSVDISYKEFIEITKGFMQFIMKKVLDGESVQLPLNAGKLEVVGKKIRPKLKPDGTMSGVAPDWVATKKLRDENPEAKKKRTVVYHFNEHSNGVRYKIRWYKLHSGVKNRSVYAFYLARKNKRELSDNIMKGKEYRVEPYKKIKNE